MKIIKSKLLSTVLLTLSISILVYIASPYYSAWKMMQAVKSGSAENMQYYIDFPKVKTSLKQQISTAIEKESSKNPLSTHMAKAFIPLFDKIIDELMQAERLAEFIQTQKLSPSPRPTSEQDKKPNKTTKDVSWHTSFKRINHFTVTADEISLHMQLQNWRWQVTAIGMTDLINLGTKKASTNQVTQKKAIEDEIDIDTVTPIINTDLDTLKKDLSTIFFIENDFGEKAQIQGDFHYFPAAQTLTPTVEWLDARDKNNNSLLGKFSDQELADREKFNQANQFYEGQWSDKLPKNSSAKLTMAKGKVTVEIPTSIDHYSLNRASLNQLQVKQKTAVMLTELENGSVTLTYYSDFKGKETKPIIIVKNSKGYPLRQPNSSWVSSTEAINNPQFKQAMRGSDKSISISGTPHTVDIYFPLNHKTISNEFIAKAKPQVVFGKAKSPVTQTRYSAPSVEPIFSAIKPQELIDSSIGFFEETTYNNNKNRYLKLTLPNTPYSGFAKPDYSKLKIFNNGQPSEFRLEKATYNNHKYRVYFLENTKDWSDKSVMYDQIKGLIKLKYPQKINTITVKQGESKDNITLNDTTVIYPQDDSIPYHHGHGDLQTIIAYGESDKTIANLATHSLWDQKQNSALFWGKPDYIKIKKITEWITVELPIDLSIDDLQIEKSPY